jgi:hypothetical protein
MKIMLRPESLANRKQSRSRRRHHQPDCPVGPSDAAGCPRQDPQTGADRPLGIVLVRYGATRSTSRASPIVAFHEWTRLLGPQFCAGFGNGILLGYLMYKSGLVPRRMALLG